MLKEGYEVKIEHLAYLLEVSDCKSINQAAKKLYISQQALSEVLNSVERQLEFTIFARSRKGVSVTRKGEQFLKEAKEIMDIYNGWERFKNKTNSICGELNIQATRMFNKCLSNIIIDVSHQYPGIDINVYRCTNDSSLKDLLQQNTNFVLFVKSPLIKNSPLEIDIENFLKQQSDFIVTKLAEGCWHVLISPKHRLAKLKFDESVIDAEYLTNETLLLNQYALKTMLSTESIFSNNNLLVLPDKEDVIRAVMKNEGVALSAEDDLIYGSELISIPLSLPQTSNFQYFILHKKAMTVVEEIVFNSILEAYKA